MKDTKPEAGAGMVTLYQNIKDTTGVGGKHLVELLLGIRSGLWKGPIEALRAKQKSERHELKSLLPNFTVSGVFSYRKIDGLMSHSGYIALDADKGSRNPNLDAAKLKAAVIKDTYTYAAFFSAGGEGLCIIYKIPIDNHTASFNAIAAYFKVQYGVTLDPLPDVSRVRYISYDPDLYLNEGAATFEEQMEQEQKPHLVRPLYSAPTVPTGHGQAALQTAVRKILEASPGDKHHVRKRMSFLCGGYIATGLLSEAEAKDALEAAVRQTSPESAWGVAFKTVASGLKKGQEKPLLPEPLEYIVRTGKRHGEQKDLVATSLATSHGGNPAAIQQVVESIYAEQEKTILAFWDVPYDDKKDRYRLILSHVKYTSFLEEEGYRKYKVGDKFILVRVQDSIVSEVHLDELKSFIMSYLKTLPFEFDNIFRSELIDQVQKEHRNFFDERRMGFLQELPDNFIRDSKDASYFFFLNGFVIVTSHTIKLHPYNELQGLIWKEQVLEREFQYIEGAEENDCEFYTFLYNIAGKSSERLKSFVTAIGYLLHGYKDPSNPKVVILVDEAINDAPSGGTGKGLVFQGVKQMRITELLDGKVIDFKDKFAFQGITEATRVMVFEDWDGKRLPFDKLFNMATTMLKVEKKHQGQVTFPYEVSPKLGITTNDMVGGEGDSHARRKFEIEVAPYYHKDFTPKDEFGHNFFKEWDAPQWQHFDNMMLGCCQLFLNSGLVQARPINLNRRKLIQATRIGKNTGFASFMDSKLKDERGPWLQPESVFIKADLWRAFIDQEGISEKELSQNRFNGWLKLYAEYEGIEANTEAWARDILGKTVRAVSFKVQM